MYSTSYRMNYEDKGREEKISFTTLEIICTCSVVKPTEVSNFILAMI